MVEAHADKLLELCVTQVVLLLSGRDALWEARLERLVGELIAGRVEEAFERVGLSGLGLSFSFLF